MLSAKVRKAIYAPAGMTDSDSYEMDYPVFVAKDKGIPLMQALGNTKGGLPYTLFIDRNGQVFESKMGQIRQADLDKVTERLLKN